MNVKNTISESTTFCRPVVTGDSRLVLGRSLRKSLRYSIFGAHEILFVTESLCGF
ncbi:hypothetical protein IKG13_04310 [Candidatus Saccharibacteria bacterium]|nr:hypothetical protein [Candidatus Saccharibacteria bacterium]MBR3378224.1 hypothetical protein [Candidatus Saccharibacteria bacterium]